MDISKEWIKQDFGNLTELIGHMYKRYAGEEEAVSKNIDEWLKNQKAWYELRQNIQSGDKLVFFHSPENQRRQIGYREGYAIFRNDEVQNPFVVITKE